MPGRLSTRVLVVALGLIVPTALVQRASAADKLAWTDAKGLTIEGKGFQDTARFYDRLPAKAEGVVRPPVWSLSRDSAGINIHFVTDSPTIAARWTLCSERLAMPHMAATGVSGVDLYARDGATWRWVQCGKAEKYPTNEVVLAAGLPAGKREYRLYLPLYNGVEQVEIGVREGALIEPASASDQKPIVVYGTSICHGACASRPGMTHSAILGRRLNWPVINLGFSGNAKMEPEVAQLLSELDPAVYVIDALPNMNGQEVKERAEPLVKKIRAAHPDTPIVLVEDRNYADSWWNASRKQRNDENQAALKQAFANLQSAGVKHLHYVPTIKLLGEDRDDTVDGSHPTDLGFARMADGLEPVLRPLLK